MVIECSNLGKLAAVLMKMEEETDYKWHSGDKLTAYIACIEPNSWPVWLEVNTDFKTITWSEEKIIGEEYMTDDEYLHLLTLSDVKDDPVNHPSHYTQGKVECIDAMEQVFGIEAVKHFCLLNWFKYNFRHELKNGQEDMDKASWYFEKYRELLNR